MAVTTALHPAALKAEMRVELMVALKAEMRAD